MSIGPFRRFLVALDGSRLAEAILPVAAGIALRCGGELVLFHVLEPAPPPTVHREPHLATADAAERYLESLAGELRTAGLSCRVVLATADHAPVAACIAQQARALGADVIALTTHGSGGIRGFLFGRIAQQVLQEAERPTLVAPARRRDQRQRRTPAPPRTLLVPLDPSPDSRNVLPLAQHLAACLAARVVLARVVPSREQLSLAEHPPAVFLPSATAALLELERRQAEEDLRAVATSTLSGLDVAIVVRQGNVVAELARLAEAAELVLLTTHGRAGLPGWLAGSVAARLLEQVATPLLLVPAERKAQAPDGPPPELQAREDASTEPPRPE